MRHRDNDVPAITQQHDAQKEDVNHHFNGRTGWFKGLHYNNPTLHDVEQGRPFDPQPLYFHRDVIQRVTWRPQDLLRYISPTYGKPFRMLVQASNSPDVQPAGNWRRRAVTGNAPLLMMVSSWALGRRGDQIDNIPLIIGKSILVVPAILFLVMYPMGKNPNTNPKYPTFPHRSYEYPKHALNKLDADPTAADFVSGRQPGQADARFFVSGEQKRRLRPRRIVVFDTYTGKWDVEHPVDGDLDLRPYIFISFAAAQYYNLPHPKHPTDPAKNLLDIPLLDARAQRLAEKLGVTAYWADFHCRAKQQPEATDDVHRFCDVTRGAQEVCIMMPDHQEESLVFFGQRLWCLPEVLLASNHKVLICKPNADTLDTMEPMKIIDFPYKAWCRRLVAPDFLQGDGSEANITAINAYRLNSANYNSSSAFESDGTEELFRVLAEHFSGQNILSRLELIQIGLNALRSRAYKEFQTGDMAYALETLLTKRPRMDPSDSESQALARLSLANDSDRIVERMVCLAQPREPDKPGWFSTHDELGANLWDVEPLCQVAGVCRDDSLMLDGCHGISIRWKNIPQIFFLRQQTWKKLGASLIFRSGPVWFLAGIIALGRNIFSAGVFLIVVGIILLLLAPWSITTLYGGKVWGAKPWLVGFEGTLPLTRIEHLTFGNSIGRFRYTPSSGPFCTRRVGERIGDAPSVDSSDLPKGMRLFTLIDTGNMTVTVFAAARPPSVALLCGKEGGMLRAVLCSYKRSTNALTKECVLRMDSTMWDESEALGWVKLG